ncbi:MAG TPA: DUF2569 family protein [Vicinamibacterales bacterium]|jgi:hypothetical protein
MTESPRPVGGWLMLLCRLLLVYQPLSLALSASAALDSLPTRGPKVLVAIAIRVIVTGVNVAAGLALTNRAPAAVTLAKVALLLSAACDVFILTTSFYPNNRPPGDTPFYVAATILYHGVWFSYLVASKRVKQTYL